MNNLIQKRFCLLGFSVSVPFGKTPPRAYKIPATLPSNSATPFLARSCCTPLQMRPTLTRTRT